MENRDRLVEKALSWQTNRNYYNRDTLLDGPLYESLNEYLKLAEANVQGGDSSGVDPKIAATIKAYAKSKGYNVSEHDMAFQACVEELKAVLSPFQVLNNNKLLVSKASDYFKASNPVCKTLLDAISKSKTPADVITNVQPILNDITRQAQVQEQQVLAQTLEPIFQQIDQLQVTDEIKGALQGSQNETLKQLQSFSTKGMTSESVKKFLEFLISGEAEKALDELKPTAPAEGQSQ